MKINEENKMFSSNEYKQINNTPEHIKTLTQYTESGNYRALRRYLQSLSPQELRSIAVADSKEKSLPLLAVEKWTKVQFKKISEKIPNTDEHIDAELYNYVAVTRILVAYGFNDPAAGEFLFQQYQPHIMESFKDCANSLNELHRTIGEYVGDDRHILHAARDTLLTFNNANDLTNYYKLIIQNQLLPFSNKKNYKFLKSGYNIALSNLKEINSKQYISKMEKLINTPKKVMKFSQDWDQARGSATPYLSECSCTHFSRKNNTRREQLESRIIRDTITLFSPQSCSQLNYLTLGFGEGLEDFILIGKYIKNSYQSIKAILIEPNYQVDSLKQFKELNQLAEKYRANLQIVHYSSLKEYQSANNNEYIHIISAIDFENIFKEEVFDDVIKAHTLLENKGRFYLSFSEHDICFSKTTCISYASQHKAHPLLINPKKHLNQLASMDRDELRYASLGLRFNFEEWMELIPTLINTGCKKISFTMIHPKKNDYFGNIQDKNNSQLNEGNLRYLFKLLLSSQIEVDIKLVDSFEEFKKIIVNQSENKFHVVSLIGHEVTFNKDVENITNWLKKHMPDSILLGNFIENNQQEGTTIHELYELPNLSRKLTL